MGPNQTYKCLHSKGNHKQNEKNLQRKDADLGKEDTARGRPEVGE